MKYATYGFIAFGGVVLVVGASWLSFGSPQGQGPVGTIPVFVGGITFVLVGLLANRLLAIGGVVRLRVDDLGLHLSTRVGRVRNLLWTDPRFQIDIYDVSGLPESNSFVRDDSVWRYGLIVRAPFLSQCRFPREMYDSILARARERGLEIVPSPSTNFDSGEKAFRLLNGHRP